MKKLMLVFCATALLSSNINMYAASVGKRDNNQALFTEMMTAKDKDLKKIAAKQDMDAKEAADFAMYATKQVAAAINNVGKVKDEGGDVAAALKNLERVQAISAVATKKVIETSPKD